MRHNLSIITRTAMVLLLTLLTAATAGAETVQNVAYVDASGNAQTASNATVVTSDMGGTSTANFTSDCAWYYVNSNVTLNGAYNNGNGNGTQNIILGDGATLTVNGLFKFTASGVNLNIYCQSGGTGTSGTGANWWDNIDWSNPIFWGVDWDNPDTWSDEVRQAIGYP